MNNTIKQLFNSLGFTISRTHPILRNAEINYEKYKYYTMISRKKYIANIELAYSFGRIDGCFVECGTWRGGMSAGMAEIFPEKLFYLFDSFEGLPEVKEIDGEAAVHWQNNPQSDTFYDNCKAEINLAEKAMSQTKVKYKIVKGWFSDTLPEYKFKEEIAILRLDADWYDSTMECLRHLYPKVAKKGLIIIDDYFTWDGCSRAIHDYLSEIKSISRIYTYNPKVAYIIKED